MPLNHKILPEESSRLRELRHRHRVIMARKKIEAFVSFVFGWKLQEFQKNWHKFASKYNRALIFAPQAHGKTCNMSLIRPLFILGHHPNRILKIISCNDDKAVDILGAIAKLIESNKRLREVFPNLKPAERGTWTKHQITIKRDISPVDASVEALGVLSTGSGDRATDLMFDDPVDFRNAILQPALRKMVIRAYTATWLGLFAQGGERITYICNAWHHNDLTHEIKKPNYHYHILNQAISKDFKNIEEWVGTKKGRVRHLSLWKGTWPSKRLIKFSEERGSLDFNRAFRHQALESRMFPFTKGLKASTILMNEDAELKDLEAPQDFPRFTGVDLGGIKKQNAQSAIFTLAIDPETLTRWPVDIRAGHWSGPETARQLLDVYKKHEPFDIFVENNAYQHTLAEWMEEIEGGRELPIEGYYTGGQKLDLQIGLPGIALQMEKGLWKIPDLGHSPTCKCEMCQWREELSDFPIGSSDLLMSCVPGPSLVRTRSGYTPIKDIIPGIEVLTHHGRFKKVLKIQNRISDKILKVKTIGMPDFYITKEHPVLAAEWFKPSGIYTKYRKTGEFKQEFGLEKWKKIPGLIPSKRRLGDALLSTYERCQDKNNFSSINKNFAFICGLYLAEGSVGGIPKGSSTYKNGQVSFAFHEKEKGLHECVRKFFEKKVKHVGTYQGKTKCVHIGFRDEKMYQFFKSFGKRSTKCLPWKIFDSLSVKAAEQLFLGWASGDGTVRKNSCSKRNSYSKRNVFRGVSISYSLINQMREILLRLGIASSLKTWKNDYSRTPGWGPAQPAWSLVVTGDKIKKTGDFVQFGTLLEDWNTRIRVDKKFSYHRFMNYEELPWNKKVYNIEVEEDNSYIVEGIIVHNCWLADRAARRGEEEPNIRFIGGDDDYEEDGSELEGVLSKVF